MKNKLVCLTAFCCFIAFFFACKKQSAQPNPVITSFDPQVGAPGITVKIYGENFDSITSHITVIFNGVATTPIASSDTVIYVYVPAGATTGRITVTVNGRAAVSKDDFTILPGKWTQVVDGNGSPPFGRTGVVSFTINKKGYYGLGNNNPLALNDLWEYDPAAGNWTKKASAPISLFHPFCMVINDKAYIGTGITNDSLGETRKFWEYDPTADTWTPKADFPGQTNFASVSLSIGGYGYAGLGAYRNGPVGQQEEEKNWWQYNPAADSWAQKKDFPGPNLDYATSFTLNGKGYLGISNFGESNTWWLYDPANDVWTQKTDYPGGPTFAPSGIVVGNKGYVMDIGICWQYDDITDSWAQKAFYTNLYYDGGGAFGIGNYGYFVSGETGSGVNTTWKFDPGP